MLLDKLERLSPYILHMNKSNACNDPLFFQILTLIIVNFKRKYNIFLT